MEQVGLLAGKFSFIASVLPFLRRCCSALIPVHLLFAGTTQSTATTGIHGGSMCDVPHLRDRYGLLLVAGPQSALPERIWWHTGAAVHQLAGELLSLVPT